MEVSSCSSVYVGASVVNVCDSQVLRMETLVTLSYSHSTQTQKRALTFGCCSLTKKTCKRTEKNVQTFCLKEGAQFQLEKQLSQLDVPSHLQKDKLLDSFSHPLFSLSGLYCANCLYHPGRISVGEACISYFLMPPPPSPSILYASLWGRARQINEHTISMFSIYVAWENVVVFYILTKGIISC